MLLKQLPSLIATMSLNQAWSSIVMPITWTVLKINRDRDCKKQLVDFIMTKLLKQCLMINHDDNCMRAIAKKITQTMIMLAIMSKYYCNDAHRNKQVWTAMLIATSQCFALMAAKFKSIFVKKLTINLWICFRILNARLLWGSSNTKFVCSWIFGML